MMQSDEMIVGKRVSLCVLLLYWLYLCSLGWKHKSIAFSIPVSNRLCCCPCVWLLYGLLVAPCGFVCDIVSEKNKTKSTDHPHANQSRARGMLGCREPRWKPARRPPIRWSSFRCPTGQRPAGSARCTAAASNQSGLPSEEEQHGRAAVSDTQSTHCCSPQRSDLQAT